MTTQNYQPFIVVPPLTTCRTSYIVFGQGVGPYTIYPFSSGQNASVSLEAVPPQRDAVPLAWTVDFDAGANITWAIFDATGAVAYSDFRVVQSQLDTGVTRCPKTDWSRSQSPSKVNIGGIIGGVVSGLVVVILGVLALFFLRRREQRRKPTRFLDSRAQTINESDYDPDRAIDTRGLGGTPVVRAGTFNLQTVEFTEPSLDRLRMSDAPPRYIAKRTPSGTSTLGDGGAEEPAPPDDGDPRSEEYGRDRAAEDRVGQRTDDQATVIPVLLR